MSNHVAIAGRASSSGYDNAFVYLRMGYASAMAWVLLVVTMALTGLMFWASRKLVYYRAG